MNALIELKELRIGNLLLYDNQIVHVTSLSLDIDDEYEDQIGFCKLGSVSNEIVAWNRSLVDKLASIPITPEWLERCWFTIEPDTKEYNIPTYSFGDLIMRTENNEWHFIFKDLRLRTITHLDQLQNLYFALTGEEITIK